MPKMTCLVGLVCLMNVRACVVIIEYDDKLEGENEYSETARPVIDLVAVGETGSQFAVLRVSHGGGELPILVNIGATLGEGFSEYAELENTCELGTIDAPVENELAPETFCIIKLKYQSQNIGHESESTVIVTPLEGMLGNANTWQLNGHTVTPAQLTLSPQTTNDFGFVASGDTENLIFDVLYSGEIPAAIDVVATETTLLAPFEFAGGAYPGTAGTCGTQLESDCTVEVAFLPSSMGIYQNDFVMHYNNGADTSTTALLLTGLGNEEISFGSEYVDAAVRDILDKLPGDPIYFSETQTISSFDFWGNDLQDVNYFPNLTETQLVFVDSPDLMEIAGLTRLTNVFVTEHALTDVSVFANFSQLHTLRIEYGWLESRIDDLSPLAGLTALKHLQFFGSSVTDISGLDGLTLDFLDLHHCDISALGDLADSDSFFAETLDVRDTYSSCYDAVFQEILAKLRDKGMTVLTDCDTPSIL